MMELRRREPASLLSLLIGFATDAGDERVVVFQKPVPDLSKLALERFVARVRQATGLKGMVDVLVTTNSEMKGLNRQFRGKDKATDVLSFPAADNGAKQTHVRNQLAGEIAISAEIAMQNARELGHTTGEEVKILVLHGLLHLRGYDHERDHGRMARRENQLRARLGLPSGLIERSQPPDGRAGRKQTR
jgi:probable rRNA maturation factor